MWDRYAKKKAAALYDRVPCVWGSIAAEFDTSSNLMGLSILPVDLIISSPPPSRLLGKAFRSSEKREEADRFPGRQIKKDTFLESPHLFHFLNVVAIDGFIGSSFDDVQLNFCDFQHPRLFSPFLKKIGANK
jgi:hypothetical protein